jgi:hypothetical protein
MTAGETIQSLKEYASRVRDAATADRGRADAPGAKLDEVIRAADEVLRRASAPVAVGVVGGFNAGKSLLLGSLVGWGDALPVSEIPTTGNLTALRLVPADGDGPAVVIGAEVEFLDRAAATACLTEMAAEANGSSVGTDWEAVAAWAKQAAQGPAAQANPELRARLGELTAFIRDADSPAGRELLDSPDPTRRRQAMAPADVRQALILPRQPGGGPSTDLTGPAPDPITPRFVSAAFRLLARVTFEVQVPRAAWDLGPLAACGAFILLDTPGLGAGDSQLRDLALCRLALRDVQTILVVLDAQTPGDATGQQLVGMLYRSRDGDPKATAAEVRDRVLVAVNRFDLLSLDGRETTFRDWTGWDPVTRAFGTPTVRATPAAVRKTLLALGKALGCARELTADDRVLLTSARWGLVHLGSARPGVPFCSPEFGGRFRGEEWPPPLADAWGRLAIQLAGDPSDHLGHWLTEVTGDGGRAALQRLLVAHVATHGLDQLARDVRRAARQLRAAVDQLPPPPVPATPGRLSTAELRGVFRDLLRDLTDFITQSETAEMTVDRDRRPAAIGYLVAVAVGRHVQGWPLWRDLFNAVGPDGRVTLAAQAADPLGYEDAAAGEAPNGSESLVAPYRASLAEADREVSALVAEAMRGLFVRLAGTLKPVTARLGPVFAPGTDDRVAALVAGLDPADQPRARNQWRILNEVSRADAPTVFERFEKAVAARPDPPPPLEPKRCFPLPGAGEHEPPMPFPWHPARRRLSNGSHLPFLIRVQDHVTRGLRHHASTRLSQLSENALETYQKLLRRWRDELESLLGNPRLLDCLTDAASGPAAARGWRVVDEPAPADALDG